MEEAVGGAGYGIEPVTQVVPESELETELVTVGSLDHLHKIDLEVPSLVDSIQSSTSDQGRWENVQGT